MSNDNLIWDGSSENWSSHTNRVVAKFKLIGVGNSEVETEITSKVLEHNNIETEVIPRVFGSSYKNTELNVMYRGISDVEVEIQPYGFIDLETEIYVRPHNRMWAMYEVVKPPIVQSLIPPIMDSFTRTESAFSVMNYGSSISMVVGDDVAGNRWTSYIKFDLTSVNPSLRFINAKMRLYTANYPTIGIEIHEISELWLEKSITQMNAPSVYSKVLADEYYYNQTEGYVEFELTEKVIEWIKNPHNNFGFMLKLKDGSNGQAIFRTREHPMQPQIILSYYDPAIFSTGRSQILTEINAMKADSINKDAEIEVGSVFSFSVYDTYIYARQPDIPVESDIEVEITATYDTPQVDITIAIRKDYDIPVEIDILSGNNISYINTEITASKYKIETEITPAYRKYLDLDLEITVSREYLDTEITVIRNEDEDIDTEISVNPFYISKIDTEITVTRNLNLVEISSRVEARQSVYSSIDVTRDSIKIEIEVKERSSIDIEIDVIGSSILDTEIIITKSLIHSEITPRLLDSNDLNSEIYVKWINLIEVEIDARATSQFDVEINVNKTSNVEADITVSKPKIDIEIYPRIKGDDDRLTIIEPRIQIVENLDTIITVNGRRGAYGFVM